MTLTSTIARTTIPTPLGDMHAVASEAGLLLLDFVDRRDIEKAMREFAELEPIGRARLLPRREPAEVAHSQRLVPGLRLGGSVALPPAPSMHLASIARQLDAYFAGESMTFATPVVLRGTAFEQRCWRYLQSIPPGETRTYGEQARAVGDAGASRAVGRANGVNFLSVIIPCHRVIASTGDLTGYGGGVKRKAWLLEHERMRAMRGG